jgi:hypothetical protein
LFVLDQPEGDGGVEGDNVIEGVKVGGDGAQAKTSVRGDSTAEMAGDNTEVEANVSTEAPEV